MGLNVLFGERVVLLLSMSALLGGIMAGFFFTYSASVVLALDRFSASIYTTVMQEINETVLNAVFGVMFFGAVVVPTVSAAVVLFHGDWTTQYGLLFFSGVAIYVVGTFAVTAYIHIPMNEYIATWSSATPPDDWTAVRARWARWNHVRTTAAILSFVLYLGAIMAFGE